LQLFGWPGVRPQKRCWEQLACDPHPLAADSRGYRYSLTYRLRDRDDLPPLVLIQLNPSTAGSEVDDAGDATSRRVAGWAHRRELYGSVVFVNLFCARCTDPRRLLHLPYDLAVGARADESLIRAWQHPDATVVAAWGKWKAGRLGVLVAQRRDQVCDLLRQEKRVVHWLAPTGHPLHGLRWEDRHILEPVDVAKLRRL
jgi:hypothetical protein